MKMGGGISSALGIDFDWVKKSGGKQTQGRGQEHQKVEFQVTEMALASGFNKTSKVIGRD